MTWYRITFKMTKTITRPPRYPRKVFIKGKTYRIRRKLFPEQLEQKKKEAKGWGYKIIRVEKI